jgi:hypothetical protein
MRTLRKAAWLAAVIQASLWAGLLVIHFWVLPRAGFEGLADFNDPARVAGAPVAMQFFVWSDLAFGVTTLGMVWVLYHYLGTRMRPVARAAVTVVLAGAVLWFIGHDLGFHVLAWEGIERDPAGTNYAMDRLLWGFRNGVFFAMSGLTALELTSARSKDRASAGRALVSSR